MESVANTKVLIATGIYPPKIGGPAQYAQNTNEAFKKLGVESSVVTYGRDASLPTGFRHFIFFWKALFKTFGVDFVFALDTFSAALPALIAAKILRKKFIIRTGGDFLWESYVERTGDLVLLRNFYTETRQKRNKKEKVIFKLTKWILQKSDALVFSTTWQRDIWLPAYSLEVDKCFIVENYYGNKLPSYKPKEKNLVAGTRSLKWKNHARLKAALDMDHRKGLRIIYDDKTVPHSKFIEKLQYCYAVVIVSLGDISPNTILDALRCNKPFILTRETGLYEKLKDVGLFVDPEDTKDIADKIEMISQEKVYDEYKRKIENFNFRHSWDDICKEILSVYKKIS